MNYNNKSAYIFGHWVFILGFSIILWLYSSLDWLSAGHLTMHQPSSSIGLILLGVLMIMELTNPSNGLKLSYGKLQDFKNSVYSSHKCELEGPDALVEGDFCGGGLEELCCGGSTCQMYNIFYRRWMLCRPGLAMHMCMCASLKNQWSKGEYGSSSRNIGYQRGPWNTPYWSQNTKLFLMSKHKTYYFSCHVKGQNL